MYGFVCLCSLQLLFVWVKRIFNYLKLVFEATNIIWQKIKSEASIIPLTKHQLFPRRIDPTKEPIKVKDKYNKCSICLTQHQWSYFENIIQLHQTFWKEIQSQRDIDWNNNWRRSTKINVGEVSALEKYKLLSHLIVWEENGYSSQLRPAIQTANTDYVALLFLRFPSHLVSRSFVTNNNCCWRATLNEFQMSYSKLMYLTNFMVINRE